MPLVDERAGEAPRGFEWGFGVAGKGALMGRAVISLGMIMLISAPAVPQARKPLSAFAKLQPGLWQFREIGNAAAARRSICVADPGTLLQIQHGNEPCARLVISDTAAGATVHYTCPANGFGRTTVKVETPRLLKLDTQGIIDNAPFAYRAEARRLGDCPAARASR